jgi:hypothetical protein
MFFQPGQGGPPGTGPIGPIMPKFISYHLGYTYFIGQLRKLFVSDSESCGSESDAEKENKIG